MSPLHYEDLLPTRNYLQNVCLVMSAVQRAYIPVNEHDWQYGLSINLRGICTQEFAGLQISLDLVREKLRIGDTNWELAEYAAPELLKNLKVWLTNNGHTQDIETPDWIDGGSSYNPEQLKNYAEALWWMDRQFAAIKATRATGLTAPVLLYPHHFDLSLVWFPFNDHRQAAIGFSTGDESIPEPYVYVTTSPEPESFHTLGLPAGAHWQTRGFSGAALTYTELARHSDPPRLLHTLATELFDEAALLFA